MYKEGFLDLGAVWCSQNIECLLKEIKKMEDSVKSKP